MAKQQKTKGRKRFIGSILLLFCAGIAAYFWSQKQPSPSQTEAAAKIIQVTRGELQENVTAQGKLEAFESVDVGTQVSGQLKNLTVDIGDTVTQGQVLAEIDPRLYQVQVDRDAARLASLRAQRAEQVTTVTLARQNLQRATQLKAEKFVSEQALDTARAEVQSGEARIASLDAQIKEAQSSLSGNKTNLTYTIITAPLAGDIVTLDARLGQTVNASQTAPRLMQIARLDVMTVRAQVAEADIPRIQPGMLASFTTLGDDSQTWNAKVRQILPTPEIINDVVLYNVLLDVDNPDRRLMIGMSCQIQFHIAEAKNVLILPIAALQAPKGKDQWEVEVKAADATVQKRVVTTGIRNRDSVAILDGLAEKEMVILPVMNKPPRSGGAPRFGPRL